MTAPIYPLCTMQMNPRSSLPNVAHYSFRRSENLGRFAGGELASHMDDSASCFFRDCAGRMSLTAHGTSPSFEVAISHVLKMCSKKKVIRIHTRRIITAMAHLLVHRRGRMLNRPCNTSRDVETSNPERPVSLFVFTAYPEPASIGLVDLDRESFLVRFRQFRNGASSHMRRFLSFVVSVLNRRQPISDATYSNETTELSMLPC